MRQAWSPVTTGTINGSSHQEGGGAEQRQKTGN